MRDQRRTTIYFSADIFKALRMKAVVTKIGALADDPRPAESSTLPERENYRRIALRGYRLVYGIDDIHEEVTVYRIAQRRRREPAR